MGGSQSTPVQSTSASESVSGSHKEQGANKGQRPLEHTQRQRSSSADTSKGVTCLHCGKSGFKNVKLHQAKTECGKSLSQPIPERRQHQSNHSAFKMTEVRMVLVGQSGSGKSETGNHILLKTKKEENPFKTAIWGESVTKHCSCSVNDVFGEKLVLVDTPGLFDTKKKNIETMRELSKFMLLLQPGPHAIILVIRIGRQTQEVQMTVDLLLKLFEKDAYRYLIVLFTGKDSLLHDNVSLDTFIKSACREIQDVIYKSSNRCIAFNNYANEDENKKQVKELLEMMRKMVQQNGGKCYVSDLQKQLNQLVTDVDLVNPDGFRDKVLNENATSSASWMWQALVAVAATFGWDL